MTITVFRDEAGAWRWYLKTPEGDLVSESAESFESKGWAVHMAMAKYPDATLHVQDTQHPKEG